MAIVYILIAVVLIILGMGWHLSNLVIKPKVYPFERTYELEIENGKIIPEVWERLQKEEVWLHSPYGYDLFGIFIPVDSSKKTVIICHGITWSLFGSVKYMGMFRKRGFNVLIYDHRNHGRSVKKNTTFGFYEKYDLKAWVDWVFQRVGEESRIGTHGESLGAAVALQHAAMDPRTDFVIADCPFSDLTDLLEFRLKADYHLPPFPLLNLANFFSKIRSGMSFSDVSPFCDLERVTKPILLMHGQEDLYIPREMSEALYLQSPNTRMLYLAPNAAHAESYWKNQEEYEAVVGNFLDQIGWIV